MLWCQHWIQTPALPLLGCVTLNQELPSLSLGFPLCRIRVTPFRVKEKNSWGKS